MENYLKGADYERQIRDYLLLQPDVVDAWLWKDIPECVLESAGILYDFEKTRKQRRKAWESEHCLPDTGTDILVIKTDQPHVLLQAKNYDGTVQQADLAGFYRMQLIFDLPGEIWFSNKVSGVVADMPPGYTKTKLVKFAYEEIPAVIMENQVASTSASKYVLRDYQLEAVEAIKNQLANAQRTVLAMSCGCGKTLVAATVAADYSYMVVLSPLQAIAEQNLDRFGEVVPHAWLLVDAEGERDVKTLVKFMKTNKKWLLSATFKSADVVWEALNKSKKLEHTLLCFDEFHGLSKPDILDPERPLNKLLESNARGLMVSATPRVYEIASENVTDKISKYFGETAYKIPLSEAIQRKLVTDYRVFFPLIGEEGQEQEVYNEVAGIKDASEQMLSKAMFLLRGMLDQGGRKAIAYFSSHAAVEAFYDVLTKVAVEYFGLGDFWCSAILSGDSRAARKERLDKFAAHQGIAVLCNVLILSEGLDIVAADTIFMGDPCRSRVRNVQRVCRANRLDPGHPNKIAKIFVWADQDDDLLEFVASLKEIDVDFCKKVLVLSRRYERTTSKKREELKSATLQTRTFCVSVQEYKPPRSYHRGNPDRPMLMAEKLMEFIKTNGVPPVSMDRPADEVEIARWLNGYRGAVSGEGTCLEYPEVTAYLDNHLVGWRNARDLRAMIKLKECMTWINAHEDRLPTAKSKDPDENGHASFLNWHRGKTGNAMVIDSLNQDLPGWDNKKLWKAMHQAKEYVNYVKDHNDQLPRKGHSLYTWLCNQRQHIRHNRGMQYPEVLAYIRQHVPHALTLT